MRDWIAIIEGFLLEDWDHYTEIGHRRGSSIVWYLMPGGKLVEKSFGGKKDNHDLGDREGLEREAIAVGRIDPKTNKISVRTPLAPGNSLWMIPQAKLDFIAGKLKRKYPGYEIWYFGNAATDIRRIDEAKLVSHDSATQLRVWKNPSRNDLIQLSEKEDLRGICDGQDVFIWPALFATHGSILAHIGIEESDYLMPFYVESPSYQHATRSERSEWVERGTSFPVMDTDVIVDLDHFEESDYLSCRAFARMVGNKPQQITEEDYRGQHQAPDRESGAPLYDLTDNDIYPDDVYGPRGSHYSYDDRGAYYKCLEYKGRPNKIVTIYRSVPKALVRPKITKGDWVAITREYARQHGESNLNGEFKIIKLVCSARDVFTDGDSLEEWGYDPQPNVPRAVEDQIRIKLGMESKTAALARRYPRPTTDDPSA